MEEFPLASEHLTKLSHNEWIFEAEVCSFDGVGRFVMGLLNDIEIIDTPDLERYIAVILEKNQNRFFLS